MKRQRETDAAHSFNFGAFATASAVAAAVFLVLAVVAFIRPTHRPKNLKTPYTLRVTFGYSARVPAGPVYPNGRIGTNDPIFLSIVHYLNFHITYRFEGAAPSTTAGTEKVLLKLMGPNSWSRSFVLAPETRFVGSHTSTDVTLDLTQQQSIMAQIAKLTANSTFGSFSFAVQPVVRVVGRLAGQPIDTTFRPGLSFQVAGGEVQIMGGGATPAVGGASSSNSTSPQANFTPSQSGTVSTPAAAANTLSAFGVSPEVSLLRWIAVLGLLASAAGAAIFHALKRSEPFEESVRIQRQHGHLIVPIVAGEDLGWPPVDVPNIKALVRLAESGQRLILHNRSGDIDTYMVNDEGTVYRYQVRSSKVVWGEWTDAPLPVDQAAQAAEAAHSAEAA